MEAMREAVLDLAGCGTSIESLRTNGVAIEETDVVRSC
jgi:hypothetical protein